MKVKQSLIKMLDREKKLVVAAICIVMLGMTITACNDSSVNNRSNNAQGLVEADIDRQEQLNTNTDWQTPATDYNPPGVAGLLEAVADSDIAADNSIVITGDIKREFNQMGQDYRFFFMPEVTWYDFESTGAALSYMLFTWTGEFGTFPERAPKYEAEARLRKVFAAPNNKYPPLEHQPYPKFVLFDGESYTPWPESYNDNTIIYDLTKLSLRQDGVYTYYTATANEYQFDINGNYEPRKNEKFLLAKAEALGGDYAASLAKLLETLETGEISTALKSGTYTIEFRIKNKDTIPMIIAVDKL